MPSLGFKKEFVPGIEAFLDPAYAKRAGLKAKTTTIRKMRKRPFRIGDDLYLFEDFRTKKCRLIGSCICRKVEEIVIDELHGKPMVTLDGLPVTKSDIMNIAYDDGFDTVANFVRFFRVAYGLPFRGQRIHFTTTYNRKYFCNKSVKQKGYKLKMTKTERTIELTTDQVAKAASDRHVRELMGKYQYGVQIINPMLEQVEPIAK